MGRGLGVAAEREKERERAGMRAKMRRTAQIVARAGKLALSEWWWLRWYLREGLGLGQSNLEAD